MTQVDFDRLPLLLRLAQVERVLEGVNRRSFIESVADGSLRHWPPAPDPRKVRYYLKADVARMAGLRFQSPHVVRLLEWHGQREILAVLGLGRDTFLQFCQRGLLEAEHERHLPWRTRLRALPPAFFALNAINAH